MLGAAASLDLMWVSAWNLDVVPLGLGPFLERSSKGI